LIILFAWLYIIDGTLYEPPLELQLGLIQTDKEVYHPGEMVKGRFLFHKNGHTDGIIKWSLNNSHTLVYSERILSFPAGIYDKILDIEFLPNLCAFVNGSFYFSGVITYQINPLKNVSYEVRTTPFKVMPWPTKIQKNNEKRNQPVSPKLKRKR
jgi:hypothetical protein